METKGLNRKGEKAKVDEPGGQSFQTAPDDTHSRFESLVNSIDGIVWEADASTFAFTFVSKQAERILGYPIGRWTDEPDFWSQHLFADDRDEAIAFCARATQRKEDHQLEYRMVAADGRAVWVRDRVTVHVADGRPVRLSGVMMDITTRRNAEEESLREKHFIEAILDSLPGAFYMYNEQGERLRWNKHFEIATGYTFDEIAQHPLLHNIAEEQKPAVQQAVDQVFATGRASVEADAVAKDGSRTPYFLTGHRVTLDGQPCLIGMAIDITEQKRAEERISLLQMIAMDVAGARDLDSALEVVLRRVCEKTGWALGQAWVPSNDGTALDCCPAWFAAAPGLDDFRTRTRDLVFERGIDLPGRAWLSAEAVWVRDVSVDENFPRAKFAKRAGLKAGLGVPILAGSDCIAVLEFFLREPRDEDERLVKVISAVAAQIGLVIESKRAEQELRRVSERLQLAASAASIGIWDWDVVGDELVWDDGMYRLFGIRKEDFSGAHDAWTSALAPEDLERTNAETRAALRGERGFDSEYRIIRPDGSTRYIKAAGQIFRDDAGNPVRMVGINYDITERKMAEDALRENREELVEAQRLAKVGSWTWDVDTDVVTWSDEIYRRRNVEPGQPIPRLSDHGTFYTPESWERLRAATTDSVENGTSYELELELIRPGEQRAWTVTRSEAMRDATGRVIKLRGTTQDITERKLVEEALRESQRRFSDTLTNLDMIAVMADADGNIMFCNDYLLRLTGWGRDEAIGRNWFEMFIPEQEKGRVTGILDEIPVEGSVTPHFENEIKTRSGERRLVKWTNTTLRDLDGRFIGIAAVGDDITEQKRAEQQIKTTTEQLRALTVRLRHAREEEGTRIAREIHDELGAALTSLKWDLEAMDKLFAGSDGHIQTQPLRDRVRGMTGLIDTTVNVVRRISSELRPSILDDLGLAEAIEWQTQQFQTRTGIDCHCDCSIDDVQLDQDQSTSVFRIFQEALTNVLRHAQATRVDIGMEKIGGEFVLTISDDGRGITDEEKSESQSLGLVGIRERAFLIGGHIEIQGTAGKGTVITVRVPLSG